MPPDIAAAATVIQYRIRNRTAIRGVDSPAAQRTIHQFNQMMRNDFPQRVVVKSFRQLVVE